MSTYEMLPYNSYAVQDEFEFGKIIISSNNIKG